MEHPDRRQRAGSAERLLALILHGEVTALVVALGYLGISTVIGSILDPHIMGHRLGLSTLVVVLSLLFWGWTWGPVATAGAAS